MLIFVAEDNMPDRVIQKKRLVNVMENFGYPQKQHRIIDMEG